MANNDFSAEVAENYEEKCLCVLVLDISGSMSEIVDDTGTQDTGKTVYMDGKTYNIVTGGVSKLDNLIIGLRQFYDVGYYEATYSVKDKVFYFNFLEDKKTIVRVFPLEDYRKIDPDEKMETYKF